MRGAGPKCRGFVIAVEHGFFIERCRSKHHAGQAVNPVLRLPATECAFYREGHCFYPEHLNPGYDPAFRCGVLIRLHQVYDDFLGQADAFSLEEASARSLWEKRFTDFRGKYSGCQDHKPSDMNEFPGCAHALGDVCAKALPPCPGRCQNYVLKRLEQQE